MEIHELHRGRLIDHLQLVVKDLAASKPVPMCRRRRRQNHYQLIASSAKFMMREMLPRLGLSEMLCARSKSLSPTQQENTSR
jgi:hypothetical protein